MPETLMVIGKGSRSQGPSCASYEQPQIASESIDRYGNQVSDYLEISKLYVYTEYLELRCFSLMVD